MRALVPLLALLGACRPRPDEGPEATARRFAEAASRGEARAAYRMLDSTTRAALERIAARAHEQAGAAVHFRADEMLAVGLRQPPVTPTRVARRDCGAERCVVRVEAGGAFDDLDLVREDGAWRVRLDVAAKPASALAPTSAP